MSRTSTGLPASFFAHCSPPKPAPTITTLGMRINQTGEKRKGKRDKGREKCTSVGMRYRALVLRFSFPISLFPPHRLELLMTDWLSDADRRDFEARWNDHPGMRHMGARVDLSKPGVVRCIVDPVQ